MDQNHAWQEQWPGPNTPSINSARALPLAVEITLELEDWGVLTRLIEVPT
jgi:type II secretion system protein J